MSKARSPRDVCSTTIGISGLMLLRLLAAWGPNFHSRSTFLLLRSPKLLSGFRQVDGDSPHPRHHLVERLAHAKVGPQLLQIPALAQAPADLAGVLPGLVGLLPNQLVDFLVAHLDRQFVSDSVQDELA